MKRIIAVFLAAMLLCSCGDSSATSSTKSTVSGESSPVKDTSSKKDNSSKNTSSWVLDVAAFVREIDGEKYFDVSAAAAASPRRPDDSEFFPELDGFVGYYIEKGVYMVDAETMYRVIECPFKGEGSIKWVDFKPINWTNNSDQYDGVLPISKIHDVMYQQLCLPSVGKKSNGRNQFEILPNLSGSLTPLCAVYLRDDKKEELPDDAQITLCFGEMKLAACLDDGKGWFLAMDSVGPDKVHPGPQGLGGIIPLPWELGDQYGIRAYNVAEENISWVDDHFEVKITGADIKGKKFNDSRVTGAVIHTWGAPFYYFDDQYSVMGVATNYKIWIKESEWSGFFIADTGADCRQDGEPCRQTFGSRMFTVTDQPTDVFGLNVGPKRYDEVMDSKKVQELLNIR